MKILAITTSPGPNSNSRYDLEKALEYLENVNVETKTFDINKLEIKALQDVTF